MIKGMTLEEDPIPITYIQNKLPQMDKQLLIGNIKLRVTHTDTYEKLLNSAYLKLKTDDNDENKVLFLFSSVAYLEYYLNLTIIEFCNNEFPDENARKFAEYYIKLSISVKIELLPSILSKNKFVINYQNDVFQALRLLIKNRNNITHNKDFYETLNSETNKEDVSFEVSTAKEHDMISSGSIDRVYNSTKSYVNEICKSYSEIKEITNSKIVVEINQ